MNIASCVYIILTLCVCVYAAWVFCVLACVLYVFVLACVCTCMIAMCIFPTPECNIHEANHTISSKHTTDTILNLNKKKTFCLIARRSF